MLLLLLLSRRTGLGNGIWLPKCDLERASYPFPPSLQPHGDVWRDKHRPGVKSDTAGLT